MEKEIQIWTKQRIQELLTLCGVGDSNDERIKQSILLISDFVHEARLEAGIEGTPETLLPADGSIPRNLPTLPTKLRGSYRLLDARKYGGKDYQGLTRPSKRKRKPGKKRSSLNKPSKKPISKDGETSVSGGVREPSHTTATNQPGGVGQQLIDTASAATGNETNQETSELGPGAAIPIIDNMNRTSSTGSTSPQTDVPHAASPLPIWQGTAAATRTMTTILWNCVKLNYTIGKYGRQTKQIYATTKSEEIRQYADIIAQSEYAEAVHYVIKDKALFVGKDMQDRYNETVFWEIILKGAKLIDPATLSTAKGPDDGFSVAEKRATKRFMEEAGYGTSLENQRQYRNFWKSLCEMRKAGVNNILLYRTKEFDSYCKGYPKSAEIPLLENIISWEKVYGPQITQLEGRVIKASEGDITGRFWLNQPQVQNRLKAQGNSWNDAANEWFSSDEETSFKLTKEPKGASADDLGDLCHGQGISEGGRNKSFFVSLLPRDDNFLAVCPIIPVQEGDFLGIFAGMIRYSENFNPIHGIRGPAEKLWLDYSQVTGTLNQMQVSKPGDDANVRLQWEVVDELGGTERDLPWRVSIRAVRTIRPFEELIREAPQKDQYLMHQSPDYACRGFMKNSGL